MKSVVASKSNKARVKCWPSVHDRLTKVGCRQRKQSSRRREQVDGIHVGWCGIRSFVSTVSSKMTAGFANRRGILSRSNVSAQSQPPLSSKTTSLVKERSQYRSARHLPSTTEVKAPVIRAQCPPLKDADGGKDGAASVTSTADECEPRDEGTKKAADGGCSGWWWWDTAWNDLTTVTPADVSTFWNELSSWLTTSTLDDDDDDDGSLMVQTKPPTDNCSSCISGTAQHDSSLLGIREDEDEMVKTSNVDNNAEPGVDKNDACSCGSVAKTALMLRAASHGHRDVVCDILRQVAAVDTALHHLVNCVDSQVL